jgi:NAD(P)-dependent dehydrogenase (short-subunit alcohol dehydrogenase family)/acyl dehydratase
MPKAVPARIPPQPTVRFTEQDVGDFRDASGDWNPLHVDHEYARATAYGQPVIFGCLGAMECLRHIHLPAGWLATSLEAEFSRPMFLGVAYRVESSEKDGAWRARLFDGSAAVLSVSVNAQLSPKRQSKSADATVGVTKRSEAILREEKDLVPGLETTGEYSCDGRALERLALRRGGVDRGLAALLCWSSYLVGMELPGKSALFSRLALQLTGVDRLAAAMNYRASITSVDSRFGQIVMDVSLGSGTSTIASGQCWSFVRPLIPPLAAIDATGVKADSLAGRSAVILGSSRGLGAAIVQALEIRGAAVYGMSRSASAIETSRTEVGDVGDPEALRRLRERVLKDRERLDFLVCNACPPVLPLRLEPSTVERISAYVDVAVSLTLAPLAEFLELLNRSEGCVVVISSIYVGQLVKEFPHYIAAKHAVEALARVASLQYRRVRTLIVRPRKMLTAMTNTPMGRLNAEPPHLIANRIAARLESPLEPGMTEFLD